MYIFLIANLVISKYLTHIHPCLQQYNWEEKCQKQNNQNLAYHLTNCHYQLNEKQINNIECDKNNIIECIQNLSEEEWAIYTMFSNEIQVLCLYYKFIFQVDKLSLQIHSITFESESLSGQLIQINQSISKFMENYEEIQLQQSQLIENQQNQQTFYKQKLKFMEKLQQQFNDLQISVEQQSLIETNLLDKLNNFSFSLLQDLLMNDQSHEIFISYTIYLGSAYIYCNNINLNQLRSLICSIILFTLILELVLINYKFIGLILRINELIVIQIIIFKSFLIKQKRIKFTDNEQLVLEMIEIQRNKMNQFITSNL